MGKAAKTAFAKSASDAAPVACHGGIMCGDELSGDHALQLVSRTNSDKPVTGRYELPATFLCVRMLVPERLKHLIGESFVPASSCAISSTSLGCNAWSAESRMRATASSVKPLRNAGALKIA